MAAWFAVAACGCVSASSGTPGDEAGASDGATPDGGADGGTSAADAPSEADGPVAPRQCPAPTVEAGTIGPVPTPVCTPVMPSGPTILTFAGDAATAFGAIPAPLIGGTFVYPACSATAPEPSNPLFQDFSADGWHITGNVSGSGAFGLWWVVQSPTNPTPDYATGLLDVSGYSGFQFDVAGNAGPLGGLFLTVQSANQQAQPVDPTFSNCGSCDPDAGRCNVGSGEAISITPGAPVTVRVRWAELTDPQGPPLDLTRLTGINWAFSSVVGASPYPVDVTLANLQFFP